MKLKFYKTIIFCVAILLTISAYGQKKLVYVVGSAAVDAIESQDQLLMDSISQWVDIRYLDQNSFNGDLSETKYDTIDGVIIFESVNSKTIVNFGITEAFPVPCITMEAGLISTWGLLEPAPDGGIWGYAGEFCEEVDLEWQLSDVSHPILQWAGMGAYQEEDVVTWSGHEDPASYGIPYLYGVMKDIEVIAVAARTESGDNPDNDVFEQEEALSIFEIPSLELLYMCAAKAFIEGAATQDFWNILHESVLYMFDPREDFVGLNALDNPAKCSVYPNPAYGQVTISTENVKNASVMLTNYLGQKVAEFEMTGNHLEIETGNLSAGLYFISFENQTLKLIVK